ncbi:MAG: pantoate--beta-alanine ligase [Prevotellaceae bacterium]|nr:pantoate--beta-alanine ligase [Prevotellaceae bacterium]
MERYSSISELQSRLDKETGGGATVGFVPTMGALHEGHLSLVALSRASCDVTAASIFVNPTQFNDREDYRRYPRSTERDCAMLRDAGCDIVFTPSEEEMYPAGQKATHTFDFGHLDKVMEGAFRPGHFDGVAQVVSRLFDIARPDKAFFGQKDFQQTAIIKAIVAELKLPIEIVVAPIVREAGGLAMSSRNVLLSDEQRAQAANISRALFDARTTAAAGGISPEELRRETERRINATPELAAEYVAIVDGATLLPVTEWSDAREIFACTAVRVGKTRLIDNVRLL